MMYGQLVRFSDHQGFFGVHGAEIRPTSQWNLGGLFPNFVKKNDIFKKKNILKIGIFIQTTHTHKLQGDILLQLMAIVCV